jgi:hypothetical protein
MNIQALILQLQAALAQPSTYSEEQLRKAAQDYAAACAAIGQRLTTCILYLRQGFRSEALRLADLEPNLLDQINSLNFPQRSAWMQLATQLGIATGELSFPLAMELNEAYDGLEAHRELVGEFRLLNILRRSAAERANVLQLLKTAEPARKIWDENLSRLAAK